MQALSSSPCSTSCSKYSFLSPHQNSNPTKLQSCIPFKKFHPSSYPLLHPIGSHDSSSSSPLLQEMSAAHANESDEVEGDDIDDDYQVTEKIRTAKESFEESLAVRRPVMDSSAEEDEEASASETTTESYDDADGQPGSSSTMSIDAKLSKFARSVPIFEPERINSVSGEKPLLVNLDLSLYRAKVLAGNYRYQEAENILQKCIYYWPEDGRSYVALGKVLSKQSKWNDARAVYEQGCQATQAENPYIWQCWAVLENKMGNIMRARELFDAATVADKRHISAWHGWAMLELNQGNIKKARNLLGKGLKYCGGNEYIYQTLALLEAKAERYEQARHLFRQATKCNPKSCASWLAWAQLEAQQENHIGARKLFEEAVQASPRNRFAWHVWGVFESSLGFIDQGKKLLRIGHAVNPRDPVLLQSLGILEYKYGSANLARRLFKRASELNPKHQSVWTAWGWMEWKEGNLNTARELYQKALSIDSTTESAARCLQAWGVLEERSGNLSAAQRLFRSSVNAYSQSYVTWMTWASSEEDQGNSVRAEEIRNLYFQRRTEIVDDASWIMGFADMIDPSINRIKRLPNLDQTMNASLARPGTSTGADEDKSVGSSPDGSYGVSNFDLDNFVRKKLSLDASKLDIQWETPQNFNPKNTKSRRKVFRSGKRKAL